MYIRMHEGLGQVPTPLIRCGVDMDDVDVKLREDGRVAKLDRALRVALGLGGEMP